MNRKRGFTLIELLVVIGIIALLVGLLLPALAKAQRNAKTLKDKTQIKQAHQAMLIFANDNRERLPVPGVMNRLAHETLGESPGQGPEDFSKNHTRHLYSMMIAQQFFNPDLLIGPTEVNAVVREDTEYNFDAYRPADDIYWDGDNSGADDGVSDGEFAAQINGQGGVDYCNTSYAHMAVCGQRKRIKWRNTQEAGDPILATRGTEGGATTGDEYTLSPTLQIHGADMQWVGNVVFNDNHAETLDNFYPPLTAYECQDCLAPEKDNIFAAEFDDFAFPDGSGDAFTGIFEDSAEEFVGEIFDELLQNG